MILSTDKQEIEFNFKTVNMIKVSDYMGGGDVSFKLQQAAFDNDLKVLSNLIKGFTKLGVESAYNFIDEWVESKSVQELYTAIFDGLNKYSFFTQPLTVPETPPININGLVDKMISQAAIEEVGKELSMKAEK